MTKRKVEYTDKEWKEKLPLESYRVLRRKATEPPFQNAYFNSKEEGTYRCKGCNAPLFSSQDKFDSKTGWPSFTKALANEAIELHDDFELGHRRTEVVCKTCGGHLGHVFDDGPMPTRKRYCVNSCALDLKKQTS
jgi:peptide-methionine (R)-S-oxide reductase